MTMHNLTENETENLRAVRAQAAHQAQLLIEALPWIKDMAGKTVVVKYGGAAMTNNELRADVMSDIVLMKLIGLNPVIVHGGGNEISDYCRRLGLPVEFEGGFRVTTPEVMDVVKMVLLGKVNQELVAQLNQHGHLAVGLNGADGHILKARSMGPGWGQVGEVDTVDTTLLVDLVKAHYIPVIASIAVGENGASYNINADLAAGAIAAAIGAHKVIFLTDVDGLYRNFQDKASLLSRMSLLEAEELLLTGTLSAGMIPKIQACVEALRAGVSRAHILNGTIPHALLLEIFTNQGVGTMLLAGSQDKTAPDFEEYPHSALASKLHG